MIPLSRPSVGEEEVEAAARVIRSGWLSQGAEVEALEREFALYLDPQDPPHVVAMSSCTTALHACLLAMHAGWHMAVAAPSYTFVATVNAALYCDVIVTLREIDARTFNLDPSDVFFADSARIVQVSGYGTVLAVHQAGLPCDVDAILAVLPKATILEDAACAIGARYADGARVGSRHDTFAACFSLHGSKSIVAGEGGLVATRRQDVAARIRTIRQHGVDVEAWRREKAQGRDPQFIALGYNYCMSDLQAAIARVQIQKADAIVAARRHRAHRYSEALRDVCMTPVEKPDGVTHAYQRYLVRVATPAERERLVNELLGAGISCRRGIPPIHRQPYWIARWGQARSLPVTEEVADTTVQLPLWAELAESDQERVIEKVREVLSCARKDREEKNHGEKTCEATCTREAARETEGGGAA